MPEESKGYVYILTNPYFREDWVKIGKSSRPVDVRSKELDNTAVPLPFEIYATLKTTKFNEVDKQIHNQIDRLTDLRIRKNREFFNIAPTLALEIMSDMADLLDDAEVCIYVDGKPQISTSKEQDNDIRSENKKRHSQRKPFSFDMVDIPIGSMITFDPTGIRVKVASGNKVEYEGRLWSLSAFTGTFLPIENQLPSGAYQGPKFFSYGG